jgi:hypothetical protein
MFFAIFVFERDIFNEPLTAHNTVATLTYISITLETTAGRSCALQ